MISDVGEGIPFVVMCNSGKKLSVRAWAIFARSSSRAMNMIHAQIYKVSIDRQ
jgi:hypothetical protein